MTHFCTCYSPFNSCPPIFSFFQAGIYDEVKLSARLNALFARTAPALRVFLCCTALETLADWITRSCRLYINVWQTMVSAKPCKVFLHVTLWRSVAGYVLGDDAFVWSLQGPTEGPIRRLAVVWVSDRTCNWRHTVTVCRLVCCAGYGTPAPTSPWKGLPFGRNS